MYQSTGHGQSGTNTEAKEVARGPRSSQSHCFGFSGVRGKLKEYLMKKFLSGLVVTAALLVLPTVAFADDYYTLDAASDPMGLIQTAAVTGPITFGEFTYVPCSQCGGAQVVFLGTVETLAVVGPITWGPITYIPPSE